ncbi:MAG TPA: penicillin-binding protein 2 [Micropepsaceae bacterium]|nr:penicillin-binding protein 2 [Micropepsaceae bacterium]
MPILGDGHDTLRAKTFTRRSLVMGGGVVTLFAALTGRIYHLQVVERERYAMLAEDNRVNVQLLPPLRGRIFDRFGVELASNRQNYRAVLIPEKAESVERALDALAAYIPISDNQRQKALREARRNKPFTPITVAENLTWEQFASLNLNIPDLSGVEPDVGDTRHYPFGPQLSHVLGYVAAVSERDLENTDDDDPLLRIPGFRIGKQGVERAVDRDLRGKAGVRQIEVNAYGRVIRELSRDTGTPGEDVVLTLDMEIQKFTQARVADQSASVVVMDIHNGDIIALVSNPGFDPNDFNVGISHARWKELTEDPLKPLINKALTGQYPPGSTFKMLTAIAAIEAGVIPPESTVHCSGRMSLGSHDFHCWKRGGHGSVNMIGALKYSCDIYFYEVARRCGVDKISEVAHRFGLGETFGFEVPGEKRGNVPSQAWKLATTGEPWQQGETLITGIGQGYLLATPLQLAVMTARIANGGRAVVPHILRSVGATSYAKPVPPSIGIPDVALDLARQGMNAVSNEPGGTAYGSRIVSDTLALAGKTGTAQVRRITREERATGVIHNDNLPWHLRDHALFVAFAPVDVPRYAISVIVEHGGSGSKAAAPVARDVMQLTLERDPSRRAAMGPSAGIAGKREG